jgi:DNA-binding MarR family transcriptional regulator
MATRSIARLYDRAFAPVGLRAVDVSILARLAEDGPLTLGNLATRLALERTTCSREVRPLLEAGLAEVVVGKDRRQRIVRLTALGAERLALANSHWETVQGEVVEEFGGVETGELVTALHALTATALGLAASGRAAA